MLKILYKKILSDKNNSKLILSDGYKIIIYN